MSMGLDPTRTLMTLIVHVAKRDKPGFYGELYKIDMEKGEVTRIRRTLVADNALNSMVCLGSVLYILGSCRGLLLPDQISKVEEEEMEKKRLGKGKEKGACLYHKAMSYIDLNNDNDHDHDHQGWMEAPFVTDPPFTFPCVVAFLGKIYLFLSTSKSTANLNPGVFVFDPVSKKWQTLLLPPYLPPFHICYPVLADPDNNRILVCFVTVSSVFGFYPASGRWELITDDLIGWHSKITFADGILFLYVPGNPKLLSAYHFASKQRLNLVFTSKVPDDFWRYELDSIFYAGNNLICLASYSNTMGDHTDIYVYKLRFKYSPGSADLLVTPLSTKTYTIDTLCSVEKYLPIKL